MQSRSKLTVFSTITSRATEDRRDDLKELNDHSSKGIGRGYHGTLSTVTGDRADVCCRTFLAVMRLIN